MAVGPATDSRGAAERTRAAALLAILLVAFIARLALGLAWRDRVFLFGDSQSYRTLGHSVVEGRGLQMKDFAGRTRYADRMPGYPLVLAALEKLFGEATVPLLVLQSALGALAAYLAWLLGREVAGPLAGWVAAAFTALGPWQVYFAGVALTECWSAALLLAMVLFVVRAVVRRTAAWSPVAGAACAALVYVHPEFAGLPILLFVLALLVSDRRRWLACWGLGAAVVVLALLPWWLRNDRLFGRFVPATTRLGVTLYDGVRPGATGASDMSFEPQLADQTRGLVELEYDAWYLRRSWQAIRDAPGRAAALALVKAGRTWSPVPHAEMAQRPLYALASAAAFYVMAAGAALGLVALRRRPALLLLLLAPAVWVTMVHLALVGSIRYRAPVEPMLFVLAGAGAAWLLRASNRMPREPRCERDGP